MELLRTSRTLLRRWREDDLPAYFEIYSRWEIMRWLGPQPRRVVADLEEARQRLARRREREAGLPLPYGLWALVVADATGRWSADPVGTVLLLPLQDASGTTGEVEIGWNLHPDHQGRGLVTEAARALLGAAAEAGLTSVLAVTDPDNTASQAVARRLGMRDEGLTDRWFSTTTRQFRWESSRRDRTGAAAGPGS
ncbi:GNAT family N-acetyltransferase [Couchioplanes azureus]|uniref:GNAT family N-acetyltransferase n=1 Tax=Couchioplanes caeruleus TaxID=56438 RepID=UPI0016713573|nr:GNAT family N-acetyltransferase [Couchioplanes caeruleus]GGQ75867.1 N-acetyltransferase [Couchioplanes caeruleus subsp. azureus]